MRVSITNKDIIKLAAPISLSLLIPQVSFFTNTLFLGMLGEREMGVIGITGIFYLILSMIGYGLSTGMQVQMSRRAGENDNRGLAEILTNGAMLSVMFALGLMILSLWLVPVIFTQSLHNSDIMYLSVNYVYLRVSGLPFLLVTQLFSAFYVATNQSRFLIYGSIAATVVNVMLDYVLIFGKAGFPAMGLAGSALASILSEVTFCAVLLGGFFINKLYKKYPLADYVAFDFALSRRTLKIASPLIVQFMFSIGGWQIFFIFIEHLGKRELAASQILRSIFGIVGVGTWALATACSTMVSNIIGQGRRKEVMGLVGKIAGLSFLYALIMCVVLFIFSKEFMMLYTSDTSLAIFAVPSLRVIVVATLVMALSTVVFNGVVGTGNTLVNLTMEVTCVSCYLIYCYIVVERMRSPLYICWGAEFVYWTSLIVFSFSYLKSGRWKGKKI